MASTIQSFLDNGRAYDMSSLLTMYQHILKSKGIDADSYTKHKLKLRMQSHFGDDIVFHQQFDKKKPELVYSSKISLQDVINSAALELHTSNKQVISDEANAQNCIFEAAKIIKHEIKECKGISARPLDVSDLNENTVRRLVPNNLYWLLRWIIGPTLDIEDTSTIDEKKGLSIAQDIIHCSSNARVKTPKHVSLAMSTHHLTGSKQIIILLNRMGHCISYDEMKNVDASLATGVLAQSEEYDTVLPSNISPGSFIQMGSNNDDFNEETIDGKNTTHVTTMVVYQRKPFGPEPKPTVKGDHSQTRGSSSALEVKINSPSTPVPKQWAKYISNPRNKINLCTFLTQALSELGRKKLPQGKCLVIGGGCSDGESSLHIRRDHATVTLRDLQANHEEADTRLLFHAKHASQPDSRIIIHSPDTDVLVLGISFYDELGCKELWLRTGSKDRLRYIPLYEISIKVGPKICKALPEFHALTGSDATSAFAGVGKKRAYNIFEDSEIHQESLSQLGQITLTEDVIKQCVKFVFSLYPTTKKTPSSMDELRYLLFCQKRQKSEALPPTSDSFIQHLKRANYQILVWRKSLIGNQDLPEPQCSG